MSFEKPLRLVSDNLREEASLPSAALFTPEQASQINATAKSFGITEEALINSAIESYPDIEPFTAVQTYVLQLIQDL
jgi:hypothetical protein